MGENVEKGGKKRPLRRGRGIRSERPQGVRDRTIRDMARYFVAFLMSCQRAPVAVPTAPPTTAPVNGLPVAAPSTAPPAAPMAPPLKACCWRVDIPAHPVVSASISAARAIPFDVALLIGFTSSCRDGFMCRYYLAAEHIFKNSFNLRGFGSTRVIPARSTASVSIM